MIPKEKSITFQNNVIEKTFYSSENYKDPFNEIELDVVISEKNGSELRVPAFWAGGNKWVVRYATNNIGNYRYKTICSNKDDKGLQNREGEIKILRYKGKNKLLKHGPLKISENKKYLEHLDGNPFLWLADTWWFALVKRFKWPKDFKLLTQDRLKKGFSVIQIVAGLLPEIDKFDPRGENEEGWPWSEDFKSINPAYFDVADIKICWLVQNGLVPCIFAAWGYYLPWLGIEKMKKHCRYLVARWGAYPLVWSVAGEANKPYYFNYNNDLKKEKAIKDLQRGWTEISKYFRSIDPYRRLITVHPSPGGNSYSSRHIFHDYSLFDIDMLQTGHCQRNRLEISLNTLKESLSSSPVKPVINGEVCYEGIGGSNWQDTQRFLFWTHILSGAAGHTYGAQGIWAFRDEEKFVGCAGSWSDATWREAYKLPGSYQLGIGKKFMERFRWYKFEPHPEWVNPHSSDGDWMLPYAAGIPREVRIIYFPGNCFLKEVDKFKEIKILNIEEGVNYIAYYFNPRSGEILGKRDVDHDENGTWLISGGIINSNPSMEDWVLVLEKK